MQITLTLQIQMIHFILNKATSAVVQNETRNKVLNHSSVAYSVRNEDKRAAGCI